MKLLHWQKVTKQYNGPVKPFPLDREDTPKRTPDKVEHRSTNIVGDHGDSYFTGIVAGRPSDKTCTLLWSRRFCAPASTNLRSGKGAYFTELPKAEYAAPEWRLAMQALTALGWCTTGSVADVARPSFVRPIGLGRRGISAPSYQFACQRASQRALQPANTSCRICGLLRRPSSYHPRRQDQ